MREILFRAKHKEYNEWVEGDLIHEPFGECIQFVKDGCRRKIKIDPETACQYTGTPDKNRKKIFEGDIVRRKIFENFIVGQVVWIDIGFCGFYLKHGNKFYPMGKDENTGISDDDEVIGNIFDNPELIGG